jgi:D-alanine-D-alanine ligase
MKIKKRIGVLAGGLSSEREVSLRSGRAVFNALRSLGYDVVFIDVNNNICDELKKNKVEIAFIALHGGYGENGAIQGLLEILGIPYTGSGILASALSMDKEASKKIFLYHSIPVAPFLVVENPTYNVEELIEYLPLPWIVKPNCEGSSIGVSIVKERKEILKSFENAFAYGKKILIERYIKGKEIQIGILGERVLGGVEVRPSTQFYNYEAKYTPGATQYILPPEIDSADYERLKELALKAHKALGCKGATRVDFILSESKESYILEVNTIPGMTETSLLPKIAKMAGLDFPDLIEEILELSLIP